MYVEQRNIRSARAFLQNGYRQTGNFRTYVFRRISPKKHLHVVPATPEQVAEALPRLQADHNHMGFLSLRNVGYQNGYYLFMDGERVIGSVQANVVRWQFKAMPGMSGVVLMHLVPRLPVLNRLFRPHYSFLAIEALAVSDKKDITVLLESLLFHLGKNSVILQVDDRAVCFQPSRKQAFFPAINRVFQPRSMYGPSA